MSLFKSREWWSTQCGSEEQFDKNSFLVTRLSSNYQYVIIGSHCGVLRIYQPASDRQDDGHLEGYRPNDLIIETQLQYPILQLCAGRLVSGSQIIQLAILYPRSVGVYSLVTKSGVAEHGDQNSILLVYEHTLKRSASSLVVGAFGGAIYRDFMCVQTMDGMLAFFEQEIFSFCCFLPDFLLPAPIVFVKSTDSFVTLSSDWRIDSFSYKRLSENGQNTNQTDVEGKKFDADWSYNLGESILDMSAVGNASNENYDILILGERNMYCLTDLGQLKFMKRFDFSPRCFQPYYLPTSAKLMILVVSETNTLLIFENSSVRWSAQLSFLPIAISRGFFGCVDGTLVLLSDLGFLQLCYLGTEPQMFTAPPLQHQEIDFERMEQELNNLNKIIKSHKNNDISVVKSGTEKELILNINYEPQLEPCTFRHEIKLETDEILPMCQIIIELTPNTLFEEVQVTLIAENSLKIYPNIHFVNNLEDKIIFNSVAFLWKPLEIMSLELKVIVSYIATSGVPKVLADSIQLPMKLAYVAETPFKDADYKVTLNVNDEAPALSALFPEFADEQSLLSTSAICFKNISGASSPVTILSAKNSQRYRLQSNSTASLNLFVEQLIIRLEKHFTNKSDFKITFSSGLPVDQLLECVQKHYTNREMIVKLQNQISELSAQFRLIQKRLITKFKDKNPTPLNNLDILMKETYNDIIKCSEQYIIDKEEFIKVQCELSCIIRLITTIIKYSEVPEMYIKHIGAIFVTPICDIEGQSWEDVMDTCMTHLFRTVIAKSEKDRFKNTASSLEQIKDINKFKKRVSQLLDRILKITNEQDPITPEKEDVANKLPEELPQIGSKIAVSSVRAQSAKLARPKLLSTPEEIEEEA